MLYGPDRCLSDCYICHLWEGKRGIRGTGEQSERGREGGMAWQVKEGGIERVNGRVHVLISCVSVADLLVRKQIFSLSDSINLPHLS